MPNLVQRKRHPRSEYYTAIPWDPELLPRGQTHVELRRRWFDWSFFDRRLTVQEGQPQEPRPVAGGIPGSSITYDPPWPTLPFPLRWAKSSLSQDTLYGFVGRQLPVVEPQPFRPLAPGSTQQIDYLPTRSYRAVDHPAYDLETKRSLVSLFAVPVIERVADGVLLRVWYEPPWFDLRFNPLRSEYQVGPLGDVIRRPPVSGFAVGSSLIEYLPRRIWSSAHPAYQTRAGALLAQPLVPTSYGNVIFYAPPWPRRDIQHPSLVLPVQVTPVLVQPRRPTSSATSAVRYDPPWPQKRVLHPAFEMKAWSIVFVPPGFRLPEGVDVQVRYDPPWPRWNVAHPAYQPILVLPNLRVQPSRLPEGVSLQISYDPPWPGRSPLWFENTAGLMSVAIVSAGPQIRLPEGVDLQIRYAPPWPTWNIIHPAYALTQQDIAIIQAPGRLPSGVDTQLRYDPPWPMWNMSSAAYKDFLDTIGPYITPSRLPSGIDLQLRYDPPFLGIPPLWFETTLWLRNTRSPFTPAVVPYIVQNISAGVWLVTWTGLSNNHPVGQSISLSMFSKKTVQVILSGDLGGTVIMEGSNQLAFQSFYALDDSFGTPLVFSASGMRGLQTDPYLLRPRLIPGGLNTFATVYLVVSTPTGYDLTVT